MSRRTALVMVPLLWLSVTVLAQSTSTSSAASDKKAVASSITVTDHDNGKDIDLTTGSTLLVKLNSNPSTGYSWTVVGDPSPLRLQKTTFVKQAKSASMTGAPGVQVLRFKAASPGVANLTMVYRRSWEYNVAPAQSFTIRVDVR